MRLALVGDYAYVPTYWRAKAGGPDEDGVPTGFYTAVQFVCRPAVVDDPEGKSEILAAQLADLQPEGGHAAVGVGAAPYGRMLPGIRGVRLAVSPVSRSAAADSMPGPRRSNGGGWPRSGPGSPARTGDDDNGYGRRQLDC